MRVAGLMAVLWLVSSVGAPAAQAIDFYEIQIYPVSTAPLHHLVAELHSNTVTTATGTEAKDALGPYQIHETLEVTYGLFNHLEIGQYLATARLDNGHYEYAGARTKCHFELTDPDTHLLALGGNIELDYMRRAAEENPLGLELRPILESHLGKVWVIANLALEKPFSGPGTHQGMTFTPSGEILYNNLLPWLSPALEYYGDMGAIAHLPAVQRQQHFLVPALNLDLDPRLEINLGVGLGVTNASHGVFTKGIVGWTF